MGSGGTVRLFVSLQSFVRLYYSVPEFCCIARMFVNGIANLRELPSTVVVNVPFADFREVEENVLRRILNALNILKLHIHHIADTGQHTMEKLFEVPEGIKRRGIYRWHDNQRLRSL